MKFLFSALFLMLSVSLSAQDTPNDTIQELDEVVVEKKKKAVERRADRTIFDFSEQSHLNAGSLAEGLKKLPGLFISDVAGMIYQGKQLEVYLDGRPLNIYSNELISYLEGMPANAIEKVEIITQPGAEFPATSGGAIINIVTSKKAQKYLNATYSNGYSYTNYGNSRHRFNNSLMLSAANKLFSWQINGGQSYSENYQETNFRNLDVTLSKTASDRVNRFTYLKTGLKFDFKKDRLLLNYDLNTSRNSSYVESEGAGFIADDKSISQRYYHDAMFTYQKRFDDPLKKLDFRLNFNNNNGDFRLNSRLNGDSLLNNGSEQSNYQFKADYSQELEVLDKIKFSAGLLADRLDFEAVNFGMVNLDYSKTAFSAYTEGHANYKSFEFILGGRLESYDIEGTTATAQLIPFNQVRFFPNATIQYNIMPQVYVSANYNKKIRLPSTAQLNPNNTNYQNPNVSFFGNPGLEPTLFDNYEIQLSAFEYFFINYSITEASNQIVSRIIINEEGAANVSENISKVSLRNFNFGIPLPYMLFTKGLAETLKMNFNPDDINFLYIYVGNQQQLIPGVDTKGIWNLNLMSQLVLPYKIKFTANYNTSTTDGNYYYFEVNKPFHKQMDLTFARKFLSDNLSVSVYANDILNTNRQSLGVTDTNLDYTNRYDSRRVGFSLSYKIPTKNKPAKGEENILQNEKKQDADIIIN